MRKRLALTLVLPILWALPVFSQTIFGERMPIVLRDGDEKLHLLRDQALTLTFLGSQQLINGHVWSKPANIAIALVFGIAFEAGQANAGHQMSLVETFMPAAIMTVNLFALPWNKKSKTRKLRGEVKTWQSLQNSQNHFMNGHPLVRLLSKDFVNNSRPINYIY